VGEATIKSGYPILLKPALYCPKEDIYTELRERGVDVQVRFKPLYRTSLLAGESLPASEELYKAVLILPFEKEAADVVMEVMERYRYRGCSF
jgi:dTDP-4-amino-4,6-dideoxygalactose transaminase